LLPARALAAEQTLVFRSQAITVEAYGVGQGVLRADSPRVDGYVTAMNAEIVDAAGNLVPNHEVMLHHVVFGKALAPDLTCSSFRGYEGVSIPIERFFALGEEHAALDLPDGYGYANRATDVWGFVYMLMNHHHHAKTVYVRYTVRYATGESLAPVRPVWLDVRNCTADPVFTVPGTGGPGSTYAQRYDFVMPESGVIVAGEGHLHGGGLRLELSNATCGEKLFESLPTWGGVQPRPLMHEPGPSHMSSFSTSAGIPVATGQALRLNAVYDNSAPHMRVMGIMMLFFSPRPAAGCQAAPPLTVDLGSPGLPPRMTLPLLRTPRGPVARNVSGTWVGDYKFGRERISIGRGRTFTWRFAGSVPHDVTLASGPEGFASPSVRRGSFRFRFTRPGTYKLFCSLHPSRMTQVVTVRR
jgi:plastocyanin